MNGGIIKGQATYWGGHFLHPVNQGRILGNFTLTDGKFTFEKIALFGSNRWKIEILLGKINWKGVSHQTGDDVAYKNKMAAYSYFAGGPAMTSYSKNITYLTIPFKDEKGVEHTPKFSFKNQKTLDEVSGFFYEKMASQK